MIKLNIDLRQSNGKGGISSYIKNISSLLSTRPDLYTVACSFLYRHRKRRDFSWFKNKVKLSILPERIVFNLYNMILPFSYEMLTGSYADFNIFFSYRLPHTRFKSPVVATIHDIILLRAKTEPKDVIDEHLRILKHTIDNAKYILTVSEASKQDLIDYFKIESNRIYVVHNGIDHKPYLQEISKQQKEYIKNKYSLPDFYILNFGEYRIHKNQERLIEAYSMLDKSFRDKYKLVFTTKNSRILDLIQQFGLQNNVLFIGYVSEEDKPLIFKLSSIVYYASLYEGFGVPIIEAQAARVPVVTSNTSSMPEAAGKGGAVMVNPYNVEEIKLAIQKILSDFEYTNRMVEMGFKNSLKYSWKNSVDEFVSFINQINNDR